MPVAVSWVEGSSIRRITVAALPVSPLSTVNWVASMTTSPPVAPPPSVSAVALLATLPSSSATVSTAVTGPVRPERSAVNRPWASSVTAWEVAPSSKLTEICSMSASRPVTANTTADGSVASIAKIARSPFSSAERSVTVPPGAGVSSTSLLSPVPRLSVIR